MKREIVAWCTIVGLLSCEPFAKVSANSLCSYHTDNHVRASHLPSLVVPSVTGSFQDSSRQNKAQAAKKRESVSQAKETVPDSTMELKLASSGVDKFLNGVRIAELPEGQRLLRETQWITGVADYGENLYSRPVFTESTTLFEGLFETDVPGVQGYKRLAELKAVSKAGTILQIRYLLIAYRDRTTREWKILSASAGSGPGSGTDVEGNVEYFSKRVNDTSLSSAQDNYLTYGLWLLKTGRIKEAQRALENARTAKDTPDTPSPSARLYADIHREQILALLSVVQRIVGDER